MYVYFCVSDFYDIFTCICDPNIFKDRKYYLYGVI